MNIKLFQEYNDEMKKYEGLNKGCIIDVADYEECYKYLEATAKFYIKHHENEKEIVINLLKRIKERYII